MEVVAATAAGAVEEDLDGDQTHQATVAMTSTAAMPAAIGATTLCLRFGRDIAIGTPALGNSAIASEPNA